jgi:nitrogen fixation NifU-like protein
LDGKFDESVREMQEEIMGEIRKKYSATVIENWQNPRNWGVMHDADGYGKITGPCGDTMEISIKVKDGIITRCTFDTDGCGTTVACASVITEMATGRTILEARRIDQEKILRSCGGLPEEDQHCALLAANALQKAIDDYGAVKREPWKRSYR